MKFETAGSDADLRAAYKEAMIASGLAAGEAALAEAKAMVDDSDADQAAYEAAERSARAGLSSLAHALNWAEDGSRESEIHELMDGAGRWTRTTFGCVLAQEDSSYSITCPVRLGHTRIGMSVGGAARRVCSLCGQDVSECEHQRGTAYWVPGGADELGWCRVCRREHCTQHSSNDMYRTGMVAIIKEMDLVEVSLVSKPAQPDARIQSWPVPTDVLKSALGARWTPGMTVNCDFCLRPCAGLVRSDLSTHA